MDPHSAGIPVGQPPRKRARLEGVHLVQVNPNTTNEADVDIIAIHGLDTNSPDTWTWKYRDGSERDVNWLSDQDMLPRRFPTARVFTCDWPAHLFTDKKTVQATIKELARSLLLGIQTRPGADPRRPLMFIASCLGGIILTQALVIAAQTGSEYATVWTATGGVVFLATPFRGTAFEDVASLAVVFLKGYATLTDNAVTELLNSVRDPTAFLQDLVGDFTNAYRQRDQDCHLAIFYEMKEGNLLGKALPQRLADRFKSPKLLVPRYSACLDIVHNPISLARTHPKMNKFKGPDDLGFHAVTGRIEMILCEIRNGQPIEKADVWIRNQCYTPERLTIERLSGDPLPMGQCYINLAIIERQKDAKPGESEPSDAAVQSSPFSLSKRLKIQTPDKQVQVELSKIFDERKQSDGQHIKPRRILIRGRAGVGKTTLCKKIVYDYIYHDKWRRLFDRILWVPLRRLKGWGTGSYNFETLSRLEFFNKCKDIDRRESLVRALCGALEDKNHRTLFILDGLDEVSREWNSDDHAYGFLRQLLNEEDVIITSRPFAELPHGLSPVDLELETVGFYPKQVEEYLKATFHDTEKIDKIQSFLRDHSLIQDLVRIPIQLDALCYIWDGDGDVNAEPSPETMTAVYRNIEKGLWKKDTIRIQKQHQGKLVKEGDIHDADLSTIEEVVELEMLFLEGLAFTGLCNDLIDFEMELLKKVRQNFAKGLLLDTVLACLSFLRMSDDNKSCHFIHLTYQEYFAARYFKRQWMAAQPLKGLILSTKKKITKTESNHVIFLQQNKYDSRYAIMWRFVAGMLDGEEKAGDFFKAIDEKPRDLLGPAHQRLVMHCLNEVSGAHEARARLEQRLSNWLLFECRFTNDSYLAREVEFPEDALEQALQDDEQRLTILRSFVYRRGIPLGIINLLTGWLDDQDSKDQMVAILNVLRIQDLSLPEPVLQSIAARLDDSDGEVRRSAVYTLSKRPDLPESLLQSIAARLDNSDRDVRRSAIHTLGERPDLPESLLQSIAAQLDDSDRDVRRSAVYTLGERPDLPETILQSIAAQLDDSDGDVRRSAVYVLGWRLDLPESLLQSIAARLDDSDGDVRRSAVATLGGRPDLPETILQSIAARLDDSDRDVRRSAVYALGERPDLPESLLQSITARLDDSDRDVQRSAVYALGERPDLPESLLQSIAARLDDSDRDVRRSAVAALGERPDLPESLLQSIVAQLDDSDGDVRRSAVAALGGRPDLPETILQSIAARLDDSNGDVWGSAVYALGRQPDLPESLLQSIAARLPSLGAEHVLRRHNRLFSVLISNSLTPSVYGLLLRRAFQEQLTWYADDGRSVLNTPDKALEVGWEGQVVDIVRPKTYPDIGLGSTKTS